MWAFCLLLIFSDLFKQSYGFGNFVAFQTGSLYFDCKSKDVPMWSWIGKSPTDLKSMAIGDKKQNRFKEPR